MTFRNGLASLLRPEDSVLVLIDHQPYQLANLNSHDPQAVVNNTTAEMAGHDIIHVDPIALESKIVVDATGHDAVVVNLLHRRNLYTEVPGNGAMWVSRSEEDVMDHTGEVYPNCFVIGLAVAAVYGTPRMGPAFGSMLLSGRYGAELIKKKLKNE